MNHKSNKIENMHRLMAILGTATVLGVLTLLIVTPATAETSVEKEFREKISQLEKGLQRIDDRLEAAIRNTVLVGTIMPYGGDWSPEVLEKNGWLPCDGRKLDVNAETKPLFNVIGRAFGGDEAGTYFHLPDLRGRFVRGVDHGAERDPDANKRVASGTNGNVGDKVGSVQEDSFKTHNHSIHGYYNRFYRKGSSDNPNTYIQKHKNTMGAIQLPDTDAVGGSETRPRNVYVNWIIKAKVIQP